MFEDVSEKIKDSATILFLSSVIICFFIGLAVSVAYRMVAFGLVIAIVGGVLGYFAGLLVYGYGYLIEKIECIEEDSNIIKWKIWGIAERQSCERKEADS